MLVCNVSLRPPRRAIAADVAEVIEATDATATGNIVFATLVDDPANVLDILDAYSGEIMLEAASAAETVDGSIPVVYAADVVEAATADATQDGSAAVIYATLDGTATNTTLSGGNLTATHSNTTGDSGARSTASKTSGKYYFEATYGTTATAGDCVGIIQAAESYGNMVSNGRNCSISFGSGIVYTNDGQMSGPNMGSMTAGTILSVAVDLTAGKCWFRRNGGAWNSPMGGSPDPATGVNGGTIETPSVGYVPAIGFTSGGSGNSVTINLGTSAFAYAVPSGFTGWPA